MDRLSEYDGLADSERGHALYIALCRLRHEADEARRIAAMADRLAEIARRVVVMEARA